MVAAQLIAIFYRIAKLQLVDEALREFPKNVVKVLIVIHESNLGG